MGDNIVWAVLLQHGGREAGRVAIDGWAARDRLPLRELARHGLRHNAAMVIVIRAAADERCRPCASEMAAVAAAQRTLGALGLHLHDYILWHGEACISLRLTGRL